MCQPWLDTTRSSWSVTGTCFTNDSLAAGRVVDELAGSIWSERRSLIAKKSSVADVYTLSSNGHPTRSPYLISDSGDSPSAGSNGDSTDLLAALLKLQGPGPVLATITDPYAAPMLAARPFGSRVDIEVGRSLAGFAHGAPRHSCTLAWPGALSVRLPGGTGRHRSSGGRRIWELSSGCHGAAGSDARPNPLPPRAAPARRRLRGPSQVCWRVPGAVVVD